MSLQVPLAGNPLCHRTVPQSGIPGGVDRHPLGHAQADAPGGTGVRLQTRPSGSEEPEIELHQPLVVICKHNMAPCQRQMPALCCISFALAAKAAPWPHTYLNTNLSCVCNMMSAQQRQSTSVSLTLSARDQPGVTFEVRLCLV